MGKENLVFDTIGAFILAKMLYGERLREAETERLSHQVRDSSPGSKKRHPLNFNDFLISMGLKRKARYQSDTAAHILKH
jgi:hypothetical protein